MNGKRVFASGIAWIEQAWFVCLIVCFPTRSPPADLVAVKAISYCQLWCGNFPRSKLLFKNAGDSHSFWLQNSVCHWAALRDRLFAK
jgi:hypothetical protein